jgi:hypothetical protein
MNQVLQGQIICEPPFWRDPLIIFKNYNFRYCSSCKHQLWNFIVRLIVLAVIASIVFSVVGYGTVIIPVIVSLVSVFGSIILLSQAGRSHKDTQNGWKILPNIDVVEAEPEISDETSSSESQTSRDDSMKSLARQTKNWIESQAYARGYDQIFKITIPALDQRDFKIYLCDQPCKN